MRLSFYVLLGMGIFLALNPQAGAQERTTAAVPDAGMIFNMEVPALVEITVQAGETLYDLARWSRVEIESLEALNGIQMNDGLKAGRTLVLPLTKSDKVRLDRARGKALERRKTRYLARRGGLVEVKAYRIRTGDTVWGVARRSGRLPMWLVKLYNPKVNLNRVKIGQSLQLPVLGDTVVAKAKAKPEPKSTAPADNDAEIEDLSEDDEAPDYDEDDGC